MPTIPLPVATPDLAEVQLSECLNADVRFDGSNEHRELGIPIHTYCVEGLDRESLGASDLAEGFGLVLVHQLEFASSDDGRAQCGWIGRLPDAVVEFSGSLPACCDDTCDGYGELTLWITSDAGLQSTLVEECHRHLFDRALGCALYDLRQVMGA